MRRFLIWLIVLLLLPSLFTVEGQAHSSFLYAERLEDGIIGIIYPKEEGIRYKVSISRGTETYYYDYEGPGTEFFPLQLGNGEYRISLLKNISGTKYMVTGKETVRLNIKDENSVYLQSVQNIRFEPDMSAVKKAGELTEGIDNTMDKVKAIYRYIAFTLSMVLSIPSVSSPAFLTALISGSNRIFCTDCR